ncbi:MAG: hypothetical protein K2X87_12740 [Gemmataceae bacterium]|nr:hypothetical protein [Gemmataceae bacterium]
MLVVASRPLGQKARSVKCFGDVVSRRTSSDSGWSESVVSNARSPRGGTNRPVRTGSVPVRTV